MPPTSNCLQLCPCSWARRGFSWALEPKMVCECAGERYCRETPISNTSLESRMVGKEKPVKNGGSLSKRLDSAATCRADLAPGHLICLKRIKQTKLYKMKILQYLISILLCSWKTHQATWSPQFVQSILQCHKCRACIMCKMLSMAAAVLHFQQGSVAFSCVSSVWEIDGDQWHCMPNFTT